MTVADLGFRSAALLSLALTTLACADPRPAAGEPDAVPDPPFVGRQTPVNSGLGGVVMIVVDTLRADYLGAYGSTRGLTPRIDEFAERSHLFERAVAASSWTRPSIAAMLTSRFPTSIGLLDKTDSLADAAVTLPEVLRNQAGFQTLAVITNGNISAEWGFDQGFDEFVWPHLRRRYPGDFPIHVAEGVTHRALELLDQRDPRRPFFLFVLYVDPHDPYLPHPELHSEPAPAGRFDGSREQLKKLDRLRLRAKPEDYDRIRHLYAGEVKYADHWIGRLLDGLEERDLFDEVMIALTADHGEGLWSHGLRHHGNDLYEESVHVPLLVHYPGMTAGDASRIDPPVSLTDLAPTILAAAGALQPPSFQGFDLQHLTDGQSREPAFDYVYSEMDHRGRNLESIRRGDWKLIRTRGEQRVRIPPVQLFDLSSDPDESHDLAHDARLRPRRRLAAALEKWSLAVLGESAARSQLALSGIDKETLENLRGLGYIGDAELEAAMAARTSGRHSSASTELPQVSLSELDFTRARAGNQVESGLSPLSTAGPGAAMGRKASVLLRRQQRHDKWRIQLITPEPTQDAIVLTVSAGGGERVHVPISGPGTYLLEAPLPPETGPTVRLELECTQQPTADTPIDSHCVTLLFIDLQ